MTQRAPRPETAQRILLAIERVAASGREPTMRNVRARMVRDSRAERGSGFGEILPLLRRWQAERLERASGRIDAAVDAIVALRSKLERAEVARLVEARTARGVRVRFIARSKPRSGVRSTSRTPPTGSAT